MFAINHVATGLVLKKRFPEAPLPLLLVSTQLVEILWVLLNAVGVEAVTTEAQVRSVADVHLSHMPYSHSLLGGLVIALLTAGVVRLIWKRSAVAVAVFLGVASHLVLDFVTHGPDLPWLPSPSATKAGLGLYAAVPAIAFLVELGYGVFCSLNSPNRRAMLVLVVLANLGNVTFFLPGIAGPESLMAGRPGLVVAAVAVQILVTIVLVGVLASKSKAVPQRTRRGHDQNGIHEAGSPEAGPEYAPGHI